ncbi:MAG TPA: hypothetical protein VFA20_32805 [Myxococcaceae bacterium]|nr:hypothetical protein [Myxococcaceae bacterium]
MTLQTTKPVTAKTTPSRKPGYFTGRLERLRDEIRLDAHLAGMDAMDRWREIEPRLFQAERLAEHLAEISFNAVGRIATEVKRYRDQQRRPR